MAPPLTATNRNTRFNATTLSTRPLVCPRVPLVLTFLDKPSRPVALAMIPSGNPILKPSDPTLPPADDEDPVGLVTSTLRPVPSLLSVPPYPIGRPTAGLSPRNNGKHLPNNVVPILRRVILLPVNLGRVVSRPRTVTPHRTTNRCIVEGLTDLVTNDYLLSLSRRPFPANPLSLQARPIPTQLPLPM